MFLSPENVQYLREMGRRYFHQQGYEVNVPEAEVRQWMVEVARNGGGSDKDTLNRQVLSMMIQRLGVRSTGIPETTEGAFWNDEGAAMDPDRSFMEKLKELEQTRRLPLSGAEEKKKVEETPRVQASMDLLLPKVSPVSATTHTTTVFMPMPSVRHQEVVVPSWGRNWIQYPGRNGFGWSGIRWTDKIEIRVAAVLIPWRWVRRFPNPYWVLQIEGVGGQRSQIMITCRDPEPPMQTAWARCVPITADTGYLKTMACPWKVSLLTAFGTLMDLGSDGGAVGSLPCDGDHWWIFGTGGALWRWDGVGWDPAVPTITGEEPKMNYSEQWAVLLETWGGAS